MRPNTRRSSNSSRTDSRARDARRARSTGSDSSAPMDDARRAGSCGGQSRPFSPSTMEIAVWDSVKPRPGTLYAIHAGDALVKTLLMTVILGVWRK